MKTTQLQIRVSEEEKQLIRQAAERAGMDISSYVLSQVLPDESVQFARLVDLADDTSQRTYALAALADFLEGATPAAFRRATAATPRVPTDPVMANYIAAMIETAAYRKQVNPPSWTREIAPLDDPWFASTLKSLRLHLLCESPPAFRRRNLFVDSTLGDRV